MKSFKEWKTGLNENAHIDEEGWGWEVSGTFEEVMAEIQKNQSKYQDSKECVFSAIRPGYVHQYPVKPLNPTSNPTQDRPSLDR